jgi:hypothetical protein
MPNLIVLSQLLSPCGLSEYLWYRVCHKQRRQTFRPRWLVQLRRGGV